MVSFTLLREKYLLIFHKTKTNGSKMVERNKNNQVISENGPCLIYVYCILENKNKSEWMNKQTTENWISMTCNFINYVSTFMLVYKNPWRYILIISATVHEQYQTVCPMDKKRSVVMAMEWHRIFLLTNEI